MSRILLIGYPPPEMVQGAKTEAAHYRTWQFLEPLLNDGHEVLLCAGVRGEKSENGEIPSRWAANLRYQPLELDKVFWRNSLQSAHDRFRPDCTVAVNFSHCLYATRLHTSGPVWMDIYGDILTIMQGYFYRLQSDRGLTTTIRFLRDVLRCGDVFSGCGTPQEQMMVGELAMAGRLNRWTFGYDFVHTILPGCPLDPSASAQRKRRRSVLAENQVADDEFVVLWCGGYNTWTDVETLFKGLSTAMERAPLLRFVSVGASTYTAAQTTYQRFQQLVHASPSKDRFLLLGWRPWEEVVGYYRESDIGINIDAMHCETLFGTRTRLTEMIASGLPVITTYGSELSRLIENRRAGLAFGVGDWRTMGEMLAHVAANPDQRDRLAERALEYARTGLSFATTTGALRDWVTHPVQAPDKRIPGRRERLSRCEYGARAALRYALWRVCGLDK
jgi:glycosyltransferase involved in cell wall biosynthesis